MKIYIKVVEDEAIGCTVNKKKQEIHMYVAKKFAEELNKGSEVDFILPIKI